MWRGPGDTSTCSGLHYRRGTLSLGNQDHFQWGVNLLHLRNTGRYTNLLFAPEGNTVYLSRFFTMPASLERESEAKGASAFSCKTCRNRRDTRKTLWSPRLSARRLFTDQAQKRGNRNRAWRSHLVEMSAIRGQEASGHWNLWHRILERRKLCRERAPAISMGSVEFWLNIKPCMCRVRLPPGSSYNYQEAVSWTIFQS